MYFERIKASPENTPPTTIPELLGYLRDRVSQVELVYYGNNRIEFIHNSTRVVMETSSRNDAEYHYTEYLWWKRIFEKPTLKIRIKVPAGVTLHTLTQIALGETELTQLPCVGCLEHYLTPDLEIVAIPPSLSTSAMVLALESDLSWSGWSVEYHPLGFTTNGDPDGSVRYTATKDGVVCNYDLGGNLVPECLRPLGHYENGHTPYWVHGKLVEDKLSRVPTIRRLQIDHIIPTILQECLPELSYGSKYASQHIAEVFGTYETLREYTLHFSEDQTVVEIIFPRSLTSTRFVVECFEDSYLLTTGNYITRLPLNHRFPVTPIGLPMLFCGLTHEQSFSKYYGIEGGWKGWFADCKEM